MEKHKTILIATRNRDKFEIVSGILTRLGLNKYKYSSLYDLNVIEDVKEKGTIVNRAKQKADFFEKIVIKKKIPNIIAVLGIDDGLILPGKKRASSHSKELTGSILSGKLISVGDTVQLARAFALNVLSPKKSRTCITKIPFRFLGSSQAVKRIEGKYPLNDIFGLCGNAKPVNSTSEEECFEYYLRYSEKELNGLFKNLS
ncbi:MAG: hypothetical protein WC788_01285 [Candidatus Paceibacterota bacterium]|jgi:hypothetical protein